MSQRPARRSWRRRLIRFQARLEAGAGDRWIPLFLALVLSLVLSLLAIARLDGGGGGTDLAGYTQAVWLLSQGKVPEASLFGDGVHLLALHWSFITLPARRPGPVRVDGHGAGGRSECRPGRGRHPAVAPGPSGGQPPHRRGGRLLPRLLAAPGRFTSSPSTTSTPRPWRSRALLVMAYFGATKTLGRLLACVSSCSPVAPTSASPWPCGGSCSSATATSSRPVDARLRHLLVTRPAAGPATPVSGPSAWPVRHLRRLTR